MFSTNSSILGMNVNEIRSAYLRFFESKQHVIVPSAPMVIKNDPTLMFTNAGMNQFKDIFLDNEKAVAPRVADTQKCLRVSGKHNDLEEVGVDTYHHTMFEMLGNWSFADYFKKEAIAWAWELLTEVYKIDKSMLYITVFGGDEADGTEPDQEAYDIWKEFVAEDRILHYDKKDNFWEMGETGPAGPCSEIHVDIRSDEQKAAVDGRELVNKDDPQVIEIWNLVFMEYQRMADKKLVPLSNKHIDTGMGLERLAMVLQGVQSNYDTDIFQPLIQAISKRTGVAYRGTDEKSDVAIRVISDHVRAVAFSITDGQLPAPNGSGYVIRRILRRAIRYAYSFLDMRDAFIYELVDVLADQMAEAFPEIANQKEQIQRIIQSEEEGFYKTLEKGLHFFHKYAETCTNFTFDGKFTFRLYDTFGFPLDLTMLMAEEIGFKVDEAGFNAHMEEQKRGSKDDAKKVVSDWTELMEDEIQEFIGYDQLESQVYITRHRAATYKKKDAFQLVFNITPFYAESGGQVGDTGYLEDVDGNRTYIIDTVKENNLTVHIVKELPENPRKRFKAVVNATKRAATANNHTATHLLHEALREVLGNHVEQKGSLVNSDYLRFDFSHYAKMTDEELQKVETIVNERVRKNLALEEMRQTPITEAEEMGAMALFGEKYGDLVRVIRFGSSVELCGGTHTPNTGMIGQCKITSEGSTQAGVRRITAITAGKAEEFYNNELATLDGVRDLLKNPKDLIKAVSDLLENNTKLQKEIEGHMKAKAKSLKGDLLSQAREVNGVRFIAATVDLDATAIKDLAFQLKGQADDLFVVLGSEANGKATLTVMISDKLVNEKGLHAGNIVRELAKEIQGGGGGQAFFATAGGKNKAGLPQALEKAEAFLS